MRVLSSKEVANALPYTRLIPAVVQAMLAVSEGRTDLPLRRLESLGSLGRLGMMAGRLDNLGTAKIIAFPAIKSADSHAGVVILFAGENMTPVAVMPAHELTARRTAAASAIATDMLARKDAGVLAIIGAGAQAKSHIEALRCIRDFNEVRVWGRSHAKAQALVSELNGASAVATVADAVDGADVVCTVTSAEKSILFGALLQPGMHINLVGSSVATTREADDAVLARGRLFVDYRVSAIAQAGELTGAFGPECIVAEIGEILAGGTGRSSRDDITIYKSLGVAAQDVAAAKLAFDHASANNIGVDVAI